MSETARNYLNYGDDAKEVIRNVLRVCKEEKESGKLTFPLSAALARTAALTGVSTATVSRVARNKPQRKERFDKITLDDFDQGVVRRTVSELLTFHKVLPTVGKIRESLVQKIGYKGSKTHLRGILHQLGFTWRKCETNRTVLIERPDIIASRIQYLRRLKLYREAGRPIVYTDETFIHACHTAQKCWRSEDTEMKIPFNKGDRLIILHAGSRSGFVHDACLIFKAHSSEGDYHNEMNAKNFMKWLEEKLIPNLPKKTVLIMDNASYHNVQEDKCPTQATKKADIQNWLNRHNVPYASNLLKAELLQLCIQNKPRPTYIVDNLLKQHGHDCLRLPPYHADLYPIELIWASLKKKVASRNFTYKLPDVKSLAKDAFEEITAEQWEASCRHVEEIEKKYWSLDIAVEAEVEKLEIMVTSSDEGTDTASECEDYSSTDTADEQ